MKNLLLFLMLISSNLVFSKEGFFNIYISADRTGAKESGIAIEQGVKTALSEIKYKIKDMDLNIITLDHRGSTPRANKHLERYLQDENALVIFSGLHSPPLLAARDYININKILMLDPWAAAGPITRYPSNENWIFRLSIDDTKAGEVISKYAYSEGYRSPYLILENTGWGKSNNSTMNKAFNKLNITAVGIENFNWGIGINQAKVMLRRAKSSGADVIFFVGNSPEGKIFMKAMSELDESERLPIRSHWGITGGDFSKVITKDIRAKIDLKFIQTSFSFMNKNLKPFEKSVLAQAKKEFPNDIKKARDIKAPTGFIHAFDLTKLLIQAMKQADLSGDIKESRNNIRTELENINISVRGLIKTYRKPFSIFNEKNIDAHEALSGDDIRFAEYGENNEIILLD